MEFLEYGMQHRSRGRVIIINNVEFNPVNEGLKLDRRAASVHDAEKLKIALTVLGYVDTDIIVHKDLTATQMHLTLKREAERDHSDEDSFMCILLSHGYYDKVYLDKKLMWVDLIWGTDAPVALRLLTECFKPSSAPTMKGKPTVFIVQACRGGAASASTSVDFRSIDFRSTQYRNALNPAENPIAGYGQRPMNTSSKSRQDSDQGTKLCTRLEECTSLRDESSMEMSDPIHSPNNVSSSILDGMETGEITGPAADVGGDVLDAGGERHTPGAPIDDFVEDIHRDSPVFIDHLLYYSTQPFHVAFSNTKDGAFFVGALAKQLNYCSNLDTIDFLQLLTRVNHDVGYSFTSEVKDDQYKGYDEKKQMPRITSRLSKRLIFRKKIEPETDYRRTGLVSENENPQKRFRADNTA